MEIINKCFINNNPFCNIPKCKVVSYKRRKDIVFFNYGINNVCISSDETARELGIIFDSNLTFIFRIDSLAKSACETLGFFVRCAKNSKNINTTMFDVCTNQIRI